MLKQCTNKDDLQENTGLGSEEMCWLCFTCDLGLPPMMIGATITLQEIVKNAGKHCF